jgi:predicted ATPase
VTFLFTDIEGSTRLWQADEMAMRAALLRHDELVRMAVAESDGVVFSSMGDGIAAAFSSASSAVLAALSCQRVLEEESWPTAWPIRVRMGIHTGEVEARDGDYFGTAVNRAARLMNIAHGGQVLCSSATAEVLGGTTLLVDLGEHRLRDLDRPMRVFQVGEGVFPALRSLDSFRGNLPLQVSSFVGRERELVLGEEALRSSRVVTLTGVGGVGKTRLALHLAADVVTLFADGAWLVELAAVRDSGRVADAVASVFGVRERAGQSIDDALVDFLRTKRLLMIIDNCEHLLEPVAELVDLLQHSCATVTFLATSREGLFVEGERVVPVPSLRSPPSGSDFESVARSDSVRLFVERARAADPEFALSDTNAAAVAQVCRRLDGVPLAIELAAARINTMTPVELARALDHRFETLAGGRRLAVQRHQTLRAAIDWSYELLSESERRLLARLSVFAGGGTRQAVESVCSGGPIDAREVFGCLTSLVAKSLVVADRDDPRTRYRLLETIREYGEERLAEVGETELLRAAHGEFFAEFARSMVAELEGPLQIEAEKQLVAEAENFTATMNNAIDTGNVDIAMRLMGGMHWAGLQLGAVPWLPVEEAVSLAGADSHPLYAFALATAASQAAASGDYSASQRWSAEALHAAEKCNPEDSMRVQAYVEAARAADAMGRGANEVAARRLERAAATLEAAGHPGTQAYTLASVANLWTLAGEPDSARRAATEGLALARRVGVPSAVVFSLGSLAFALAQEDRGRAKALLQESIALRASLGYQNIFQLTQAVLTAASLEDWPLALDLGYEAVPQLHWVVNRPTLSGVMRVVARALAPNTPETSAIVQGAARHIATAGSRGHADLQSSPKRSHPPTGAATTTDPAKADPPNNEAVGASGQTGFLAALLRQTTTILIETLGADRFHELRAQGEAMDEDRGVAFALDAIARARASS